MKDVVRQWFEQSAPFEGILACGVRHPDRSTVTKAWADGFNDLAIDNALRCVADLFQVLPLNRFPQGRVRWVYELAVLHCERRDDGICLAVFTARDGGDARTNLTDLERMFGEFQTLTDGAAP
jgi:hypothetical protein